MTFYDLYGARGMTIDELQGAIGSALQVVFRRRYNDDLGTYFVAERGEATFDVSPNFQDDRPEDEVLRPQSADYPVLLFVSRTERPDEIQDLLAGIPGLDFLQRENLG